MLLYLREGKDWFLKYCKKKRDREEYWMFVILIANILSYIVKLKTRLRISPGRIGLW